MFANFDFDVIWRSLPYLFLDGRCDAGRDLIDFLYQRADATNPLLEILVFSHGQQLISPAKAGSGCK